MDLLPVGFDPAHGADGSGVGAQGAELLGDLIDRLVAGGVDGVAGEAEAGGLVETKGAGAAGVGLVRVDGDDLEVGGVVEGEEGVAAPHAGVGPTRIGPHPGEGFDVGHTGLEIGGREDEMIELRHGADASPPRVDLLRSI